MHFEFPGNSAALRNRAVIAGVVGSGNLEVLIEPGLGSGCVVTVDTSARGFRAIWEAVLADAVTRWNVGGLAISINDAGATPAVVALRLDQALKAYTSGAIDA